MRSLLFIFLLKHDGDGNEECCKWKLQTTQQLGEPTFMLLNSVFVITELQMNVIVMSTAWFHLTHGKGVERTQSQDERHLFLLFLGLLTNHLNLDK